PGAGERPVRGTGRGHAGRELPAAAGGTGRAARAPGAHRGGGPAAPHRPRRAAQRDRGRHVRHHPPPPRRRRARAGRGDRPRRRLLQPGYRHPGRCVMTEPGRPSRGVPGGSPPGPAEQPGDGDPGECLMTGPALIRPYGDTTGDGRVQVSFTLPVPFGSEEERARAEGAALQLAASMGLDPAMVVHAKGMGPDFTFFIVYGRVSHLVDLSKVTVVRREFPLLSAAEVNLRIRGGLGRKLVVLGACIGSDAHTVGIDAILNVKGHAGEKGLEYYREMRVVNLGAQVDVDKLVARTRSERADAVLVSQVVSQREA